MQDYSRLMHICQLFNNQNFNIFGSQNWGEYEQLEQTVRTVHAGRRFRSIQAGIPKCTEERKEKCGNIISYAAP